MGELRCSVRVSSSCFSNGTHHVTPVTNPEIYNPSLYTNPEKISGSKHFVKDNI
jgi:hypothetical protein